MAAKTLRIEIGERLVKVCVGGSKKNLMPSVSFMFHTPAGSFTEGQINDPEALAAALNNELSLRGVKSRSVIFSLVSGKVAAREVMLPPVKENRLKLLVESNAHDYFPVDMNRYHITYTILEHIKKGENPGYRVLVLATALTILEGYYRLAEAAGLQIEAIDYGGNSQFRALEKKAGDGVTMCVNVDCTTTNISFIQGDKLLLHRVLSQGVDDLIRHYMSVVDMPEENYLEALNMLSSGDKRTILSVMREEDLREGLSRLIGNIARTSEYFSSSNWETPVDKLVLLGSCSRVQGLTEQLGTAVSLPVVHLEALPGFSDKSAEEINTIASYICCLGSGLQPVDLMPPQFVKGRKKESKKTGSLKTAVVFLVLCVLFAGGASALSLMNYMAAQQEKQSLEQQVADMEYAEADYMTYLEYQNGVTDLENLTAMTDSPNDALVSFIEELEQKMPSEIRVLSAECSTTGVDMNVVVGTKEQAATVLVQLRSFDSISDVNAGAVSEVPSESGVTFVAFAVSCIYKDTSPVPEPTPPEAAAQPSETGDTAQ